MKLKNFSLSIGTQIFKSFSDESRVRIINLLFHKNEMSISDLETILEYTQTKTSRHITYLKNSGLVNARKRDQWVLYSIKEEVESLVSKMLEFLNKDPQLRNDLDTYEILNSNRELSINKLDAKEYRI